MLDRRWRPVLICGLAVAVLWVVVLMGYSIAKSRHVTFEKIRTYVQSIDLDNLSGAERAKAIRRLSEMLNALSLEERQKARLERLSWGWLAKMTEDEKGTFIE